MTNQIECYKISKTEPADSVLPSAWPNSARSKLDLIPIEMYYTAIDHRMFIVVDLILLTFKVISGSVPTYDSVHSWQLSSQTRSLAPWLDFPLSHIILLLTRTKFGSDKHQLCYSLVSLGLGFQLLTFRKGSRRFTDSATVLVVKTALSSRDKTGLLGLVWIDA